MALSACSQKIRSPFSFRLFDNSILKDLAIAVEKEDTKTIVQILKNKTLNINFQEPLYSRTLLHLSVANNKLLATKLLLANNASLSVRDYQDDMPIHIAAVNITRKSNGYAILKLLIEKGADVNAFSRHNKDLKATDFFVPIQGGVEDLKSAKLLIAKGADIYVKTPDSTFLVWQRLLLNYEDENIFVLRHLVIEKRFSIPNPIMYTFDREAIDIRYLLNKMKVSGAKETARNELLDYLRQIDFPANGVYKEKK